MLTLLASGPPVDANHFVETTLNYVLTYIAYADRSRIKGTFKPASFIVLADNDYYSSPSDAPSDPTQQKSPSSSSSTTPRFRRYPTALRDAHKTGLGSSAAIVTALTASLLAHYMGPRALDLSSPDGRRVLHNLAQLAHCAAQGKVGSGFDVAAAVYGSSVYRRFSPSLVPSLAPGEPGFAPLVSDAVDGRADWDCEVRPELVGLPPGVAIRMCDVDCGTQTVGMVKKVLEWRDRNPEEARRAYDGLQACVDRLAEVLREGRTKEIGAAMRPVRNLMRELGRASGAPIEPDSQEAMLNALEEVEGVYGTVVPGAGGYDAAAVVMRDDTETERRVDAFLEGWSRDHGIRVRLMAVRGETEGVRTEDVEEFRSWLH